MINGRASGVLYRSIWCGTRLTNSLTPAHLEVETPAYRCTKTPSLLRTPRSSTPSVEHVPRLNVEGYDPHPPLPFGRAAGGVVGSLRPTALGPATYYQALSLMFSQAANRIPILRCKYDGLLARGSDFAPLTHAALRAYKQSTAIPPSTE